MCKWHSIRRASVGCVDSPLRWPYYKMVWLFVLIVVSLQTLYSRRFHGSTASHFDRVFHWRLCQIACRQCAQCAARTIQVMRTDNRHYLRATNNQTRCARNWYMRMWTERYAVKCERVQWKSIVYWKWQCHLVRVHYIQLANVFGVTNAVDQFANAFFWVGEGGENKGERILYGESDLWLLVLREKWKRQ